jgi:hypothetical protein
LAQKIERCRRLKRGQTGAQAELGPKCRSQAGAWERENNGLQVDSCKNIHQMKSGKYVYYSEVCKLFENKKAIIIYHHLNRHKNHGTHKDQIRKRIIELREKVNPSGRIFAIRFRPYNPRAYFLITSRAKENFMRNKLNDFINSSHGQFWDSYCEESGE